MWLNELPSWKESSLFLFSLTSHLCYPTVLSCSLVCTRWPWRGSLVSQQCHSLARGVCTLTWFFDFWFLIFDYLIIWFFIFWFWFLVFDFWFLIFDFLIFDFWFLIFWFLIFDFWFLTFWFLLFDFWFLRFDFWSCNRNR